MSCSMQCTRKTLDGERSFTYDVVIQSNLGGLMSKDTLHAEIRKELNKLNDRIDRKIVRGQRFDADARRHEELLSTLECIEANRRKRVAQIEAYRRLEREWQLDRPFDDLTDEDFHRAITLHAGIRVAEARLQWCDEVADQIRQRAAKRSRGRTTRSRS